MPQIHLAKILLSTSFCGLLYLLSAIKSTLWGDVPCCSSLKNSGVSYRYLWFISIKLNNVSISVYSETDVGQKSFPYRGDLKSLTPLSNLSFLWRFLTKDTFIPTQEHP